MFFIFLIYIYLADPSIIRKKRNIIIQQTNNNTINELNYKEKLASSIGISLPISKTILFHCDNLNKNLTCIKAITKIYDFEANHNSIINVTIQYDLNLTEVNNLLYDPMEFFVITNNLDIKKVNKKAR